MPTAWMVTWGRPGRHDWRVEWVVAHDADEALTLAREAHPELLTPRHAFPATQPGRPRPT